MKKSKEFIFPENVDKDYGIWKDYILKDFGYTARKNIKVRDNFKLKRRYANGQWPYSSTEEQMERFTNAFISRIPKYMQEAISPSLAA